jgi:hypothetical protein
VEDDVSRGPGANPALALSAACELAP